METGGSITLPLQQQGVSVAFKDVSYTYPDGTHVLGNINFSVNAGQLMCIYGPSGSGKSSILRLLTSAFKNYEGSILVNDVPLGNYTLSSLRSQTGILLSQQDIFNGTIWENIAMGNPSVTYSEVAELAGCVGLLDFIHAGKSGFETVLDPLGKKLSQRTRHNILLLRALVGTHRLLLLEQPFEHLTVQEQNNIRNYLRNHTAATVIYTSLTEPAPGSYDVILRLA
jgi:ABC-type multidrug transport system fused ATPase/permease subunit